MIQRFKNINWLWHLLFWVLYILVWSIRDLVFHSNYLELLKSNTILMLPYLPLVYLNLYFLMPRFLLKAHYGVYIAILGLAVFTMVLISKWQHYWLFKSVYEDTVTAEFFISIQGLMIISTELIILIALSMVLYLLKEWYQKERYTKELEKQRLSAELALLKQQINPHFVFNTLNTIYHLMERRTEQAKEVLMQFSDTLSHQLYDTSKEKISIQKEIEYLKNYIAIEKLRHEDHLKLTCSWPEKNSSNYQIAPMMLIPFVENAFKHGRSASGYWINLEMDLNHEGQLTFNIQNKINPGNGKINSKKGIGLANVRRRLNLTYPAKHELKIIENKESFTAQLKIQLHEN